MMGHQKSTLVAGYMDAIIGPAMKKNRESFQEYGQVQMLHSCGKMILDSPVSLTSA